MNSDATRVGAADPGITLAQALPPRLQDRDATVVPASGSRAEPARSTQSGAGSSRPRYAIVGHAGSGGMATVHVAQDLELLRRVALKQLSEELTEASDDAGRLRFLREVQITAQLDHPYIVPVYGLEVAPDGAPAYAMKFIQGHTLAELIDSARVAADQRRREAPDALPTRLDHFLKICDAVHYAHDKGVIHRDLKPANVMIGPHREIYVMDWGICRLFGQIEPALAAGALSDNTGGAQTEFGAVIGTPRYMSPEQAQGRSESLGPRSDQCALGLILYELVCLRAPFAGTDIHAVLDAAAHGRRQPVVDPHGRRVPAPLRAIIERTTARDPEQRYASVAELAEDLRRYLRGEAVAALPDTLWQKSLRYVGRHRQQMLGALLGLIAITALGFILQQQRHEQALAAERLQQLQIDALVEDTVALGDELQLRLLRLEGEVDALAAAATQLLLHGTASDQLPRWAEDYRDPVRQPADFGPQPGFSQPVSLRYGVWSQAPGVDRDALLAQAQRLLNILAYRNQLFDQARATLGGTDGGSGISRLVIALESGLVMTYPGRALPANTPDPRQTPWYQAALGNAHATWGEPYRLADTGELLLPLAEALHDPQGKPLGVLWIDVALDHLVNNLLATADADDATQLVDDDGHVLASRRLLRSAAVNEAPGATAAIDAKVLSALRDEDSGAVLIDVAGAAQVVAFDRIHPQDWRLLRTQPARRVFASRPGEVSAHAAPDR